MHTTITPSFIHRYEVGMAMRADPVRLGPHIAGWPAPPVQFMQAAITGLPYPAFGTQARGLARFFLNIFFIFMIKLSMFKN